MRFFLDTCIYIVAVSSWCLRVFKLGSIIFFNNEDVRDYEDKVKEKRLKQAAITENYSYIKACNETAALDIIIIIHNHWRAWTGNVCVCVLKNMYLFKSTKSTSSQLGFSSILLTFFSA